VARKHLLAERVDFAECSGFHPGSFKPERKPADPGKKIEDVETGLARCCVVPRRKTCSIERIDGSHDLILPRHHDGDGRLRIVDVERAASGGEFHQLCAAIVVGDIERIGDTVATAIEPFDSKPKH